MSIGDFFPTPISYNKIYRNLNDKEIAFIHNEKNTAILNIGNFTSSNKYILDTDELKDLKILLTKYINDYFKTVFEPEEDIELYITNSWLNWTENEQSHHKHVHHNSLISGVLYIDTAVDGDTINFFNPNNFLGNIKIKTVETSKWTSLKWSLPVHKNHLTLFPSTLFHEVCSRPSQCDGTRISLAFNTWFKGIIGELSGSNGLELK